MEMQFIHVGINSAKEINGKQPSRHKSKVYRQTDEIMEPDNENKILITSCDFITVEDSNDDPLQKAELELSNSELIIDELNYNISPNTSSDPCVDPLAIDDFNVDEIDPTENDSEFSLSKENIIYIVDVDDIKDNAIKNSTLNSIKISSLEDLHKKITKKNQKNYGNNLNSAKLQTRQKSAKNKNDENEMPSDGSDSGLGLETNLLQIDNFDKLNKSCSIAESSTLTSTISLKIPTKSNLKRRSDQIDQFISPPLKRGKKSIQFDNVKIFYFPRIQGFCCVPSQGGCTLGMESKHIQSKTFKLSDHLKERSGNDKLSMQVCNGKGSSSDETDSDEDLSEENLSDIDPDSSGFLQPVPIRTRRALLKAAGIKKIDSSEKDECRAIRTSREYCGCLCRDFCDPDSCSCSQSGIKCQVDRLNFPCGCSRDGCANIHGRIEFNPSRVRTHYIHTIMRLEIENKSKSSFIQEISNSESFFSNTSTSNMYGRENSIIENSSHFFQDNVSLVTNDNNFDLFPIHNAVETPRIVSLSSSINDIISSSELSYPGLKPIIDPQNNTYQEDKIDSLIKFKSTQNNNSMNTSLSNIGKSSNFIANYTPSYGSFSSAFTNFLEECEAFQSPKSYCAEYFERDITDSNCDENSLDAMPIHDLLNINRNSSSSTYSIGKKTNTSITNDKNQIEANFLHSNLDDNCSITKICTLAPTAHTSTSVFEGMSTKITSMSSAFKCEMKEDISKKCYSDNTIREDSNKIKNLTDESGKSTISKNFNILMPQYDYSKETIFLTSPGSSIELINESETIKTKNFWNAEDEFKKNCQSFNTSSSSCNSKILQNKSVDTNGTYPN